MQACDRADALIAVFCGLPGSGKTSLAAAITRLHEHYNVTVHHLCLDTILEQSSSTEDVKHTNETCNDPASVHRPECADDAGSSGQVHAAAFRAEAWKASRKQLLQQVEELLRQWSTQRQLQQEQQQQRRRLLLLVDDINHYRSMRYEFVQLARKYGASFLQVYMECALAVAQQRNKQRPAAAAVPDAVVQRLAAGFEAPQAHAHSWEAAHTLQVNCSRNSVAMLGPAGAESLRPEASSTAEDLGRLVYEQVLLHWGPAWQPPPTEAELKSRRAAGQAANAASVMHQFDLDTRTMLHTTLAAVSKDVRAAAAAELSATRKQLLQQLKQQQLAGAAASTGSPAVAQLVGVYRQLCSSLLGHHNTHSMVDGDA